MNKNCPNPTCKYFKNNLHVVKDGRFKRACDSRSIQRFKCKACLKKFSSSTNKFEFRQQKRRQNSLIFKLLSSGVSLRRTATVLNLSRGTVVRRLEYLGKKSRLHNEKFKYFLSKNKVSHLQLDDLITKENSKLKPLSVSIAVDANRRFILGAEVSTIRAFGNFAFKGHKLYPSRENDHKHGLKRLFESLNGVVFSDALVSSDEHKLYPSLINEYFPEANYKRYKSERGCVVGQGELKKVGYDPLFAINHTCAMLRANINRLIRKTWCTTKDPERLKDHLDIFIYYFNHELLKKSKLIPT